MIHFNSKVDIYSKVRTRDDVGGWTTAYPLVYKNLPCRINWSKGNEKIMFDKTTSYRDAKVYCRIAQITVQHRLTLNDVHYDIVSVNNTDCANKFMVLEIKKSETQ